MLIKWNSQLMLMILTSTLNIEFYDNLNKIDTIMIMI